MRGDRFRNWSKSVDWLAVLLVALFAMMLSILSVLRYQGYNSGMLDIGNMAQAIWSVTKGFPLEFTWVSGAFSRLALHVEVIYYFLVPLYALFPDPRALLVFQAVFFALGALPAYRIARRYFSCRWIPRIFMLFYLLYPTAQTAVLFDFHGDTLAIPLLMFALDALDQSQWRWYALWIGLALLCKFYVSISVCALGLVLWLKGRRRAGVATTLAGLTWLGITLGVIRPLFAPPHDAPIVSDVGSYFQFYFGGIGASLVNTIVQRLATVFVVFTPALWLGRYAWRWFLPALAIALPALISVGEVAAYDYRFHHYAIPVPFLFAATVYGAVKLRRRQTNPTKNVGSIGRPWRAEVNFVLVLLLLFFVLLVDTPFNPQFWMSKPTWGISSLKYGQLPRDRFKDHWLAAHVPPNVPLASTDLIAPHIINRRTVYMLRYSGYPDVQQALFLEHLDEVDYVIADALFDYAVQISDEAVVGGVLRDLPGITDVLNHPDFGLLTAQDGLLLFGRVAESDEILTQSFALDSSGKPVESVVIFGDLISLVDVEIEEIGARRFHLTFQWTALRPLQDIPRLFAVSRLEGVDFSRHPHLPTMVFWPTPGWSPGEIVIEEFEIDFPDELPPGSYQLFTGWYDGSHLEAAATDARSRVGDEFCVGVVTLP